MSIPALLKPGDKVGIAATARKISPKDIEYAVGEFMFWGWKEVLAPNLFGEYNQFAGTDEERAADLQSLLDNPEIKAIFFARGGYGTVRIVDLLNWDKFKQYPKWLVGYSDITVLHSHIYQNLGVATMHGPMAFNITADENRQEANQMLKRALTEGLLHYTLPPHLLNKVGNAEGDFVGGNLSVLYSILGSVSFPDTDGKILFLEDLDEYLYHIDRMLMGLKRAGKLQHLAGLVVGGMTDMRDNMIPFGKTAEDIILDVVGEYNYPVYFDFPAGHIPGNFALPMGVEAKIENNVLSFDLK